MNPKVKLGLYAVSVLGTLIFGMLFAHAWREANPPATTAAPAAGPGPGSTNAAAGTNAALATEITPEKEAVPDQVQARVTGRGFGKVILWGLFAVASVVGLGALIAYDVTQYAGQRATLSLFDDEGEDVKETTYELVEKAYGDGDFLETVRLLREVLKENPRAVHAQIRIAEIYERDLKNPLAAALEYEELIEKPLDPERKGWAAIHLVNLYNRLEKASQAIALLRRIAKEMPDTPAATKARDRLEAMGIEFESAEGPASNSGDSESPPSSSSSNLPPGFRPR